MIISGGDSRVGAAGGGREAWLSDRWLFCGVSWWLAGSGRQPRGLGCVLTWSGLVRPRRMPPAGCLKQSEPFCVAVPAVGQMRGHVPAAMAGGPGSDADGVPAQRGAAGGGAGRAG